MIFHTTMNFEGFSDKSLNDVVKNAPGKPFVNEKAEKVGTIISAKRVEDSKTIELEVESDLS